MKYLFQRWLLTYTPQYISSGSVTVESCCVGIRGNVNSDELDQFDISDIVYFVDYIFNDGDAIECEDEADVVVDASVDIADVVYLIDFMFNDGDDLTACL